MLNDIIVQLPENDQKVSMKNIDLSIEIKLRSVKMPYSIRERPKVCFGMIPQFV
jgi:hypothetical protein